MEPAFIPALFTVAVIGGRLVGMRLGWRRSLVVAWLGLVAAGVILQSLGDLDTSWQGQGAVIVGALIAMVVLAALAELILPTRHPSLPATPNPIAAVRGRLHRTRRRLYLAWLAGRFGLTRLRQLRRLDDAATGVELSDLLERAGGVYVKLGQFLSTRPDIVSPAVAAELSKLQQDGTPVATGEMQAVVAAELGPCAPSLGAVPVGAASIAQVHRALLADGRPVAVKVQRPGIDRIIESDLDILERLAARFEANTQWAADLGTAATMRGFARSVRGELDFRAEAANLTALGDALRHDARFVVPEPIGDLTTQRVLTLEWIDGERIDHAAANGSAERNHRLARGLLEATLHQILIAGVFHGDPHPGNLLVCEDERIAVLDCGAVGYLDKRQRTALSRVLTAVALRDSTELTLAIQGVTRRMPPVDDRALEAVFGDLLSAHLRPGVRPDSALLVALMDALREFGLSLEPDVAGALRALGTLQTTLEALSPQFDLITEASDYWRRTMNPLRAATSPDNAEDAFAELASVLPTLTSLPRRLDRMLDTAARGEAAIGVRLLDIDHRSPAGGTILAHATACVAAAALGLIGALVVLAARIDPATGGGQPLQAIGLGCVALAVLVLCSQIATALRAIRRAQGSG